MEALTIALFGAAEKGEFGRGYLCDNLNQLPELFGNPPGDSQGLYYATQALLYNHPLVFFRVQEEGFSQEDYLRGVKILAESPLIGRIKAICSPGVGDELILNSLFELCLSYRQILITNESDLLDYVHTSPHLKV